MASLQQQVDRRPLYRNAAISGPEKELRILEVRRYLDEIEASVTSLPIATVAAVSSSSDATREVMDRGIRGFDSYGMKNDSKSNESW